MKRTTTSERALVLAPRGRDAVIAVGMLGEAGIEAAACESVPAMLAGLDQGAAFVVLAEEAIATADAAPLAAWIADQEEWSDLPFVLLTTKGRGLEQNPAAGRYLDLLGNATFVERPFHPTTLISLARSALRARRRQYEARARLVALRESETRYRALFENIDVGFCVVEVDLQAYDGRSDYRVVEANPAFWRQSGWGDILGKWLRQAAPDLEEHWFEAYARVARTGDPIRFEQGSSLLGRWFDLYAFRVGAPEEARVAILFNDVSERRRAQQELHELNVTLEQRFAEALAERNVFADVVEGTDAFVQVADRDFRWLAINKAAADEFERIYGIRPAVGDSMLDILAHMPEHRAAVEAVWARALAGEAFTEVGEFGDETRRRRFYEMKYNPLRSSDGQLLGAYQFVYDVTDRIAEQRRLIETEEALRQSQKMEAMGQLTGGVAHDFNNLLTPIVGSLDMLQRKGLGTEREQRLIAGAAQSAERARTLVQRLLAFARRQPLQPVAVDIGRLVAGMGDLVSSTTGPQIQVVVDAASDLPPAKADPNQLEMALLNLSVNARDAMPEGGTLRISAAAETIGFGHRSQLAPGTYVCLSVADSGSGMDEQTLARAFEPFFSTKGIGKGTGLGLSMVHGLASQLGGALTIRSRQGLGTNVELWLPLSADQPQALAAPVEVTEASSLHGTALLVDDEEVVRLSTAEMLIDLGYGVLEASSAEDALRLTAAGEQFDLLVTDHLMPGMNGTDLIRLLRDQRPDLPVLVVSGYAEVDGIAPDIPRITKPFRKDELAAGLQMLQGEAVRSGSSPPRASRSNVR